MQVSNVKIYDLEESLVASGYPMLTEIPADPKEELCEREDRILKRCHNLVRASESNGAHGQFLTGIRVAFDLTCSNKMWVEAERYRFLEFVSSQSTMHRITKFDLSSQYVEYVDPVMITIMKAKVDKYNKMFEIYQEGYEIVNNVDPKDQERLSEQLKELYLEILYSNPAGFQLTARLTTDYRCLKNIYLQRRDHRLPEWREFCKWIETLPYFDLLLKPSSTPERSI